MGTRGQFTAVFSRGKGGKTSTVTSRAADRTVVFPVVGEAEQQAYASRRGSRDERIERDQEPLVVLPGRRLKGALLLPPLVLKRPHSEYVEVELLRRFKHLLDPVVLVAALVRAAALRARRSALLFAGSPSFPASLRAMPVFGRADFGGLAEAGFEVRSCLEASVEQVLT